MRRAPWLTCLALLLFARIVSAHPAPFSYINLYLLDDRIEGSLVVHALDAAHDVGASPASQLLDPAILAGHRAAIERLLSSRLNIAADGRALIPEWTAIEPLPDQQALRLHFRLPAMQGGALTVGPKMFPYDPLHQSFVTVYEGGVIRQQFVFSADSTEKTYYLGTTQGALAVMKTFIPSGIEHILIGPDHICFLIGLLLLGGSWLSLVKIVTAFTIGHSVTLSLAALALVSPPARVIEPAIALSIVAVGADNILRGSGRDVRAWFALVFGLVHGFGFANVLREFGLPQEALGWSLFSFNFGVEIGQLGIVVVAATLLEAIRRRSTVAGSRVAFAGSVAVIAAGTYWFVQRVFFSAGL